MTTDELMALIEDFGHASMELRSVAHTKAYAHAERRVNELRKSIRTALEAVVEDAARYRAVRGKFILSEWGSICIPTGQTKFAPEHTDAAIDAARRTA